MTSSVLSDSRPPNLRVAPQGSGDASDPSLKDPVCGMKVTAQSPDTLRYQGKQIYFCGPGCKAKFLANPAKYRIDPDAAGATPKETAKTVAHGAIYTCPMHPQIRQVGPGSCPICGMALEPVDPT